MVGFYDSISDIRVVLSCTTYPSENWFVRSRLAFVFGNDSSCPHGRCFTVLAQCFAISAWVTSLMAITSCFYIYVRPIPAEGQPLLPREGFGYISRQAGVLEPHAYRQCAWYTHAEKNEYFDSMWKAGKAMSILACVIGGCVMCVILCT